VPAERSERPLAVAVTGPAATPKAVRRPVTELGRRSGGVGSIRLLAGRKILPDGSSPHTLNSRIGSGGWRRGKNYEGRTRATFGAADRLSLCYPTILLLRGRYHPIPSKDSIHRYPRAARR